jgi:hypothetical protein
MIWLQWWMLFNLKDWNIELQMKNWNDYNWLIKTLQSYMWMITTSGWILLQCIWMITTTWCKSMQLQPCIWIITTNWCNHCNCIGGWKLICMTWLEDLINVQILFLKYWFLKLSMINWFLKPSRSHTKNQISAIDKIRAWLISAIDKILGGSLRPVLNGIAFSTYAEYRLAYVSTKYNTKICIIINHVGTKCNTKSINNI